MITLRYALVVVVVATGLLVKAVADDILLGGYYGVNETALQSPDASNRVTVALARTGDSTDITQGNFQSARSTWGTAALDVAAPVGADNSIVQASTISPFTLVLTVTNTDSEVLYLDQIHYWLKKDVNNEGPNSGTLTYTSGDLADADGTQTNLNIANGINPYDHTLGVFLSDTALGPGETATFTWAHGAPENPGGNATIRLDNFAISGHFPSRVLWLDAGAGVETNGTGAVTNWVDQSGKERDVAQTDPDRWPAYHAAVVGGSPVVRFDGVDDHLSRDDVLGLTGGTDNPAMTVFIVGKAVDGELRRMLEIGGTGGGNSIAFCSDASFRYNDGNEEFGNNPVSGKFRIATYVDPGLDYGDTRFYLDGYEATATSSSTNNSPKHLLASHSLVGAGLKSDGTSLNNPFAGDIAEIIVYDRALSASAQDTVGTYLAMKYGIASRYFTAATVLTIR